MSDTKENIYDMWTRNFDDKCSMENELTIATKPLSYYVNDFNTINNYDEIFSYTPIGNSMVYNIPGEYSRSLPSHLNEPKKVYTLPYLTSPNLGLTSNFNRENTDIDLFLKTGDTLRPKRTENDYSGYRFQFTDDVHLEEFQKSVVGLDKGCTDEKEREKDKCIINGILPFTRGGMSTRNMFINIANLKN